MTRSDHRFSQHVAQSGQQKQRGFPKDLGRFRLTAAKVAMAGKQSGFIEIVSDTV